MTNEKEFSTGSSVTRHIAENPRGTVLVLSDYRPLNRAHAEFLWSHGYSVITAITYSDAVRIVGSESGKVEIDAVVVASKVHGWHHREAEEPPEEIPEDSDSWQLDNIKYVFDLVKRRQRKCPLLFVARDLIETGCYQITMAGLEELGLVCRTYKASEPHTLINGLSERG